jgi:outer membrane protein insertion porin family
MACNGGGRPESATLDVTERDGSDAMKGPLRRAWGVGAAVCVACVAACAQPRVAEIYPQLGENAGREISEVDWVNTEPFSEDSLDALTETTATRCRWLRIFPFCFPGTDWGRRTRHLDLNVVAGDLARMTALYRRSGYFGTRVVPDVEELEGDDGPVRVTFQIQRGDGVLLDSVVVEGTEGIVDPEELASELPLQPGELFALEDFVASGDTVLEALHREGHAYAEVLRNYSVDTIQDRATAWIVAVPGPRVVVDSIVVAGLDVMGRTTAMRQVTFDEGDLLQLRALRQSQRNLYELELVQFASVSVAPDSLQLSPGDSTRSTVLVQLAEAPEHVVELEAGFGTQDCVLTGGQWVDRSFMGGGRRLSISGSLSRIGIGEPAAFAGSDLCRAGRDTLFGDNMDYRVAAELRQPWFLDPRNQVVASAFAEHQTEPTLFRRVAQGARFSLTRRMGLREVLTASVDAELRQTDAVAVLYCFAFRVCRPSDLAGLSERRFRNALGASYLRDRGNRAVNPTSGYIFRSNVLWATPLLGSDFDFVRANIEGSVYLPIRPGYVLAGQLRAGSFLTRASLGTDDFIAPEERFYAGGASSVRGYARSELGPGVWLYEGEGVPDSITGDLDVEFFPTGGTSVGVASAELRFPSPVFGDLVRMVLFADAGTIGIDPLWQLDSQWRVTPGAGFRVSTPVGPARFDIAYNPHELARGPLFVADGTGLRRIDEGDAGYRPDSPDAWSIRRFQIHIAVGQAF